MQMRYHSLANFDQGTQGGLPPAAFAVLRECFGVKHECFASPLNVCLGAAEQTFNSLFWDVDQYFGSKGDFFSFVPTSGSYEGVCWNHLALLVSVLLFASRTGMPLKLACSEPTF